MSPKSVIVKRYKNEREYQHDAQKMARKKYKVTNVVSEPRRAGFFRVMSLGLFSAFFPPKNAFVVTYTLI